MFGRNHTNKTKRSPVKACQRRCTFEGLEGRAFMSATPLAAVVSVPVGPPATTPALVQNQLLQHLNVSSVQNTVALPIASPAPACLAGTQTTRFELRRTVHTGTASLGVASRDIYLPAGATLTSWSYTATSTWYATKPPIFVTYITDPKTHKKIGLHISAPLHSGPWYNRYEDHISFVVTIKYQRSFW
jgi:hypothetical protein